MPSVKIPRKSTATDMTPFVDVAFLILAFFMLATKFKPPQPVDITTPTSVASDKLADQDAVLVEMDKDGRVFFTVNFKKQDEAAATIKKNIITMVNKERNLGLTDAEMTSFSKNTTIGVPFGALKNYLGGPEDQRISKFRGIPVEDSANNELQTWIAAAKTNFVGRQLNFMIKGDNNAKYPTFKGVIEAMRRNDQFKYQLVTDPESAPPGSDLYKERNKES